MNVTAQNYIPAVTTKQLIMAAGITLLCGFILYIYLLSATVMHVVMRKEVGTDIKALHSEISQLESEYILAQHEVSRAIATLEGFVPITDKVFIDRSSNSLVLSRTD